MKTVTIEFPLVEAVEMVRLLRAESRCLIENGDVLPDIDVIKRAQHVLSARERIVTALEEIAGIEEQPKPLPASAMDLTAPNRMRSPVIDRALGDAVTCDMDRVGDSIVGRHHGIPAVVGTLETDAKPPIEEWDRFFSPPRDILNRN